MISSHFDALKEYAFLNESLDNSSMLDDGNGGNFSNDVWNQIMSWSKLMTFVVTSSSGQQVERFEEMEWWANDLYSSERVDNPKKPEENPEIEYCEDW